MHLAHAKPLEQYETLFAHSLDGLFLFNHLNHCIQANKRASLLLGIKHRDLINMSAKELFPWKTPAAYLDYVKALTKDKQAKIYISRTIAHKTKQHLLLQSVLLSDGSWFMIAKDITHTKRINDKPHLDERNYHLLINATKQLLCLIDNHGRYIEVNDYAANFLGYPKDKIIGQTVNDIMPTPMANLFTRIREQVYGTGKMFKIEHEFRSGRKRVWMSLIYTPIKDVADNVIGIAIVGQDITEKKQREAQIHRYTRKLEQITQDTTKEYIATEKRLQHLVERSPGCVMFMQARIKYGQAVSPHCIYVSQAAHSLFRKHTEAKKNPIDRFTSKNQLLLYQSIYQSYKQKRYLSIECEDRIKGKKDTAFEISFVPVDTTRKGTYRFALILNDLSNRKMLEKELTNTRQQYKNLFDSIEEGIFLADLQGNLIILNDAGARILGHKSSDELLKKGRTSATLFANATERKKLIKQLLKQGRVIDYTTEVHRKDGKKCIIECSCNLHNDHNGKMIGFEGIFRDISERKHIMEELAKTKDFLENILHGITDMILVLDRNFKILLANNAMLQMPWKKKVIVGQTCYKVLFNKKQPCPECIVRDTFKDKRPHQAREEWKLARETVHAGVRSYPILDSRRKVKQVILFCRNLADELKQKSEIDRLAQLNHAIVDTVPSAILLIDQNYQVVFYNKAYEHLFKHSFSIHDLGMPLPKAIGCPSGKACTSCRKRKKCLLMDAIHQLFERKKRVARMAMELLTTPSKKKNLHISLAPITIKKQKFVLLVLGTKP